MPLGDSRLRQFPDAPLAHLIGESGQAGEGNRCAEPQAPLCPRLPRYCRHFAAGELKVVQCGPLRSATAYLGEIGDSAPLVAATIPYLMIVSGGGIA